MSRFLNFIFETGKTLLIALVIVVPLRLYVAQPFFVRGSSMEPTYSNGDYLIIDEISFRLHEPKRGEVIVFRYPGDPSQFFIKRIIGLPGETVSGKGRVISVRNAQGTLMLSEPYLGAPTPDDFEGITAGPNEYVVLGDNRGASSDSRRWGLLPRANIVGRVFVTVWPPEDFSVFAAPSYEGVGPRTQ